MNSKNNSLIMSIVWLLAGSVSLLFMGGKWNIPVITWIGSIFFLRYFRTSSGFLSIFPAFPFIGLSSHVYFIGLAEQVEFWFRVLVDICYTFYIIVPCLVDRFVYKRIPDRFLATLIYPAALIVVQFFIFVYRATRNYSALDRIAVFTKASYTDYLHYRSLGTIIPGGLGRFGRKPVLGREV